jgi:hypothetical protein
LISNEINIEEMEEAEKRIPMAIEKAIYTVNGLELNFSKYSDSQGQRHKRNSDS